MTDARYLRSQAEPLLQLAQQISDRKVTDRLREMAAEHLARAIALETSTEQPPSRASKLSDE
jgi:hypothetical protein